MDEEKPPVFRSWSHWYWLLMGMLAIEIILFYWLSQAFV